MTEQTTVGRDHSTNRAARSDLNTVARQGVLGGIGGVVAALGGFSLTIIVGRALGAAGAGLFFETVAIFTIFAALCTFGADTGLLRMISRYRALGCIRDIPTVVLGALIPVAFAAAIVSALLYWQADAITSVFMTDAPRGTAINFFRATVPFLVIAAIGVVASQATRGFGGVLPYVAVQNLFLPLARPLVVLVVVATGVSVVWVATLWAAVVLPAALLSIALVARNVRKLRTSTAFAQSNRRRSTRCVAGEFWSYSAIRGAASAVDVTLVWFDVLLVGALRSTAESGIYATVSRFVLAGTIVLQAMRLAIAPRMSALLSTQRIKLASQIYRTATTWIIAASWPIYIVLATFGSVALGLFGHEFTAGATALTVLALGMLANLATGNVGTVLLMSGRSGLVLVNKSAAVVGNIVLNLLLVPSLGITGAAIAWVAAIVIDNGASALEVHYLLGMRGYDLSSALAMAGSLACAGIPAVVIRTSMGPSLRSVATCVAVVLVVYAAYLWTQRHRLGLADVLHARVRRSDHSAPPPVEGAS